MSAPITNSSLAFPVKKILLAGLLVGTLDIVTALVDFYIATGRGPAGVLKYIASGVFGKEAITAGGDMIFLGLLFHYLIAFAFTFFFFWLYSKTVVLAKNRIVTGIVYGLFIWIVMNLVVVQISNTPHAPLSAIKPWRALKAFLILVFMIGLPLSFIAHRIYVVDKSKATPGNY